MNTIYLLLGGNIGDVKSTFNSACILIKQKIGKIVTASALYETAPWGNSNQASFINQAIIVESILTPEEALKAILYIEITLGRKRDTIQWSERIIDIDILFFNDAIINQPDLIVPHPHLHKRNFTLIPLSEISPDFIHPVIKITIKELIQQCSDNLEVKKLSPSTIDI